MIRWIALGVLLAGPGTVAVSAPAALAGDEVTSPAALEQFFGSTRPDSFIILELQNGTQVTGHFSSYDEAAERVWLVPTGESGFLHQRSVRLQSIHSAQLGSMAPSAAALTNDPRTEGMGDEWK